jgi:hypothetical protein
MKYSLPPQKGLPSTFSLGLNYPNPFNPETVIPFELHTDSVPLRLGVYNLTGQLVRQLLDEDRPAGAYKILWDGRDMRGYRVSSGVYLFRMETPAGAQTRRMTLMK